MAVKKKKKGEPASPGPKKAKVRKKRRKKTENLSKEAGPSIAFELKKAVVVILVLVCFIASAAMLADFYLGDRGRSISSSAPETMDSTLGLNTPNPPLVPPPETSFDPGTDMPAKRPLQGLRQKSVEGSQYPVDTPPGVFEEIHLRPVVGKARVHTAGQGDKPLYEVFDQEHGISPGRADAPSTPGGDGLPLVAIIIDDLGFDKAMAMAFATLDPHITMAILPGSPFGKVIANRLYVRDIEIMLHLPMEPVQYPEVDPGPGALMEGMSPDLLLATLRRNLDSIPYIKGVNNHMGSRLTTLSDQMRQVFTVLKKRDLFFIDSVTAVHSMCGPSARLFKLAFARRDVFLDNVQEQDYITGQFQELIRISQRHGTAIGIGHPYPATLKTFKVVLPELRKKVRIVRASELVRASG
ncbi:divergent polysaccharide deacetylase family protein [Desulfocicer niacini]